MTRKGEMFAGVTVAIVTPFTEEGDIDFAGLDKIVDWHVEQKTPCIAPVGTTGESPTLDHGEHQKVIARVTERASGRIKVMPGTGSNSTREAIELTKFAKECGADGALLVGPYYNKPTQEGYYRHFQAIAEAVDLPGVLYNIPGRTGSNITPATIARIGEHPNVVAVKEATGSMDQATEILASSNLTLLSGDDSMTLPLMSIGGSGIVSVIGNILPKEIGSLVDCVNAGKFAEAQKLHYRLYGLCKELLTIATNPIPIKTAMKLLGQSNGVLRLPMCAMDAGDETKLKQSLTRFGLL